MDWKEKLVEHGRALGREVWEHASGVGIEFEDGCDAFWVLPGEIASTLSLPAESIPPVDELLAKYSTINDLRRRALHVLRYHLADQNVFVDRNRDGEWSIGLADGSSTSLAVGAYLTAVARDTGDVHSTVKTALEHTWLKEHPSRERIDEYLRMEGDPPNERPFGEMDAEGGETRDTIQVALGWMGLCRALQKADEKMTPETLAAAARPSGRIGEAMVRLAERLPEAKAFVDLMKPGVLSIEFSDDYPGAFEVDTRSHDLARRIVRSTPVAVGDELGEEYLRVSANRRAVFDAIHRAAAARGWRREMIGLPLFGVEDVVYLGGEVREVSFKPEMLAERLGKRTPQEAIRLTFRTHSDFAASCLDFLDSLDAQDGEVVLQDAPLPPPDLPAPPPLRDLDQEIIAELDAFAAKTLADFLKEEDTLWEYRNRDLYDPEKDTWATMDEWVRIAQDKLKGEWPHPMATLILLDAREPAGEEAALRYLSNPDDDDTADSEVEIVWRHRHSHPGVAHEWFSPSPIEDVPYDQPRAKLGDPVAVRKMTLRQASTPDDDLDPAFAPLLTTARQERVHRDLMKWAESEYRCSPPDERKLSLAAAFGWSDVAEMLSQNKFLLSGLFCIADRGDQHDEPGILFGKEFLLAWSRLSPSRFLARLIATAHTTDLVALAKEADRRSAVARSGDVTHFGDTSIYHDLLEELQPAMAIAWTRCRAALGSRIMEPDETRERDQRAT